MKIYWLKVRKLRILSVFVLLCFWNNVGAVDSSATPGHPDTGERCILSQDEELGLDAMDMILKHLPEEMTNPAAICRNKVGQGSYLCRDMYNGNYTRICSGVWCSVPGSSQCTRVSASDGLPCGDQKWCRGDVCRFSVVASRRLETCPFGDINSGEVGGVSCQELISSDRKLCYDTSIQQMCCQSCDNVVVYRSSEMCRYGDRVDGCQPDDCLFASVGQFCCQTCSIVIEPLPSQIPPEATTPHSPGTHTTRPTPRIQTSRTGQTQQTGQTTGEVRQTTRTIGQTTRDIGTDTTTIGQTGTTHPSSATTRRFQPNSSTRPTESSPGQSESTRNAQPSTTPTATRNVQQSVTTNVEPSSSSPTSSTFRQGQSSKVSQGQTSDITSFSTQDPNLIGGSDAQQDNGNVVAMGTGIAVAAVLVVIIVVTVYVVRRRVTSHSWDSGSDGGDSHAPVAPSTPSDLRGTHTTWFPNYGSVNRPTFYYAENAGYD